MCEFSEATFDYKLTAVASYKCHLARHSPRQADSVIWVAGTLHRLAAGKIFVVRQVCNKVFWISVCYLMKSEVPCADVK